MSRIIAEVAQGYEGRLDLCRLYIKAAAKARANAVKFQIVYADDIAQPDYQYYDWYRQLEMPVEAWQEVRRLASVAGIPLFTDVSGDRALAMARTIRPDGLKFHSSNFFNRRLMRQAFDIVPHVFISIGGIEEDEIGGLLADIRQWQAGERITLLYGFQSEPTPIELSGLARLPVLKQRFGVPVGFLDHVDGASPDRMAVSTMAVALGADWIEKHLTISRHLEIEDYVSALEPDEFTDYVGQMRRLQQALGSTALQLTDGERAYRHKAIKKVLALRDLAAGHVLGEGDIELKRTENVPPGQGLNDPALAIGRHLGRAVAAGSAILKADIR